MLQTGKVKSREGKGLALGHTANQGLGRNSNPDLLVHRAEFSPWLSGRSLRVSTLWAAGRQGGRVGH